MATNERPKREAGSDRVTYPNLLSMKTRFGILLDRAEHDRESAGPRQQEISPLLRSLLQA